MAALKPSGAVLQHRAGLAPAAAERWSATPPLLGSTENIIAQAHLRQMCLKSFFGHEWFPPCHFPGHEFSSLTKSVSSWNVENRASGSLRRPGRLPPSRARAARGSGTMEELLARHEQKTKAQEARLAEIEADYSRRLAALRERRGPSPGPRSFEPDCMPADAEAASARDGASRQPACNCSIFRLNVLLTHLEMIYCANSGWPAAARDGASRRPPALTRRCAAQGRQAGGGPAHRAQASAARAAAGVRRRAAVRAPNPPPAAQTQPSLPLPTPAFPPSTVDVGGECSPPSGGAPPRGHPARSRHDAKCIRYPECGGDAAASGAPSRRRPHGGGPRSTRRARASPWLSSITCWTWKFAEDNDEQPAGRAPPEGLLKMLETG